jgi:lipopolysaccharide transport system ATP-binding protein
MSDVAVRVNDLGKKYRIRHQRRERYVALRDVITDGFRNVLRGKTDGAAPARSSASSAATAPANRRCSR